MKITLNNNIEIPIVGLGTFKAKNGEETYNAVRKAIEVGYRHIDTASVYGNEESVGKAIKDSKIDRKEIFVTTKVWNTDQGYKSTKKAFDNSLKRLNLDYIDLYLVHWPTTYQLVRDTYRAMEELYQKNKIRALGVSNFNIHHIDDLLKNSEIIPTTNQVELHPGLQQHKLQKYCLEKGIHLTSHSPLMRGRAFEIKELKDLAKKYNKNIVNIVVRWGIERNIIMIPKSVTPQRIEDNFNVFNFKLDGNDMKTIRKLNNAKRIASDPDNIDF